MHWTPVLSSSEVTTASVTPVHAGGDEWVIWRGEAGRVGVMPRSCPHLDADLALAIVKGNELVCHQHDWCFDANGHAGKRNFAGRLDPKDDVALPAVREAAGVIELGFD